MKTFETTFEVLGWLKIAISPALIGLVLGCIIYANKNTTTGIGLGIALAIAGIVVGIIWANKVRRRSGTIKFLSREIATPELDSSEES